MEFHMLFLSLAAHDCIVDSFHVCLLLDRVMVV